MAIIMVVVFGITGLWSGITGLTVETQVVIIVGTRLKRPWAGYVNPGSDKGD